jgi:hypothetical protein
MKLSIVIPGIRNHFWPRLTESILHSCVDEQFELIFVGPNEPSEILKLPNIKYIRDYGCPSRALQIGSMVAEGQYISYTSDDCIARPGSLKRTLCAIESDIVGLQYSESPNFSGSPHPIEYYNAWHHSDLRCSHVDQSWKIPIIFLMPTTLFYEYGGIDCRFEHINMNLHDLAFRMQRDGRSVSISNECVWDADYSHRDWSDPVLAAFKENDKPLFDSIWNTENFSRESKINLNNWKSSPSIWNRRFKIT